MSHEPPSPHYAQFRQAVRRFAPSAFLPALAAHTARLDPLVTGRGYRNDGRWPWAAAAMARESVVYSNEFRHGGTPTENDFAKLYNPFNATYDVEDDPSIADIMIPLVYEQFGYWESEFEELARVWALFGDPTLGPPIAWADVFGMELEKAARAALVLHGFAVHNGGHIDAALLDAPHMQDIYTKVAPRHELEALMRYFTVTVEGAREVTLRETEARVIRDLALRYIEGESMNALARWLNREGIPVPGKAASGQVQTLRPILTSARIAGIREYEGQEMGPANWPAIISPEERQQLLAVREPKTRGRGTKKNRYLLSGLLRCGRCGGILFHSGPANLRRYQCKVATDDSTCGRMYINALRIEGWAAAAAIMHLDARGMASLLVARVADDDRHTGQLAEVMRAERALTELAEMLGAGELSWVEFSAARNVAANRHSEAVRELARATGVKALEGIDPDRALLTRSWERLDLPHHRTIMRTLLEYAIIHPRPKGTRKLDESRVQPKWRSERP